MLRRAKSKHGKDAGSVDSFSYRCDRGRRQAPLCSRPEGEMAPAAEH